MKKITKTLAAAVAVAALTLTGCSAASTANNNISRSADNFEIQRRVVFFNGITDTNLLEIQGLCSMNPQPEENEIEVICRVEEDEYIRHTLGLSDNVSYFMEQVDPAEVSAFHYRIIFRPETIAPDISIETE